MKISDVIEQINKIAEPLKNIRNPLVRKDKKNELSIPPGGDGGDDESLINTPQLIPPKFPDQTSPGIS